MFTGLITDTGTIERVRTTDAGREFLVRCSYAGIAEGESISVNGACLTVRERGDGWFTVAAVVTTLDRTTVATWTEGRRVNLERALAVGERLGGHIVQGHVDGVGTVRAVTRRGDAVVVDVAVPAELLPLLVPHGSVAIDGVSLTVNALPAAGIVQLSLIEFTLRHTTLGALAPGDQVHVEADVIGKFVQRLAAPHLAAAAE
ncbi:MAG: riboflavin synthase [Gemmatimonadetes bacterium]|nr:riboflavin synthase [Gemmatimonadota bacterium]MBI3568391.1 riboflavin synthase [Gemmatimonadota bacterium]